MDVQSLAWCCKGVSKYLGTNDLPTMDLGHAGYPVPQELPKACLTTSIAQAPESLLGLKKLPAHADGDVSTADTLPDLCEQPLSTADCSDADWQSEAVRGDLESEMEIQMQEVAFSVLPWNPSHFKQMDVIQEAPRNQGVVLLMQSLQKGGAFVAVKKMPTAWVTSSPMEFERAHGGSAERPWADIAAVEYLRNHGCQHVCELHGVFRDAAYTYVVSSLASEGDMFSWMADGHDPGLERELTMQPVVLQLLGAVQFLHSVGIAHRDLSLENVLLTKEGDSGELKLKLVDFGMASFSKKCSGASGKRSYVAPELYTEGQHDAFLCDAFSIGVVIFCLAVKTYPWETCRPGYCKRFSYIAQHGLRAYLARRKLKAGCELRLAEVLSAGLVDLMEALLAVKPAERYGLGEARLQRGSEASSNAQHDPASVWDMPWVHGQM